MTNTGPRDVATLADRLTRRVHLLDRQLDQPSGWARPPARGSASSTAWPAASSNCTGSSGWTTPPRTLRSWCSATNSPCSNVRSARPFPLHLVGSSSHRHVGQAAVPRGVGGVPYHAETILRWHRALIRLRRTYPHRRPGRPPLPDETVEPSLRLARENPRWGHLRIISELRKFGTSVSKGSVANVLRSNGLRPTPRRAGPTWAECLRAPAKGAHPVLLLGQQQGVTHRTADGKANRVVEVGVG